MTRSMSSDEAALLRRCEALGDFRLVLAAEVLGHRLDAALPTADSADPATLPKALCSPAEGGVARSALMVAAATPAAHAHLEAALNEAEAPPRKQFALESLAAGVAISLVIFVAKLRIESDGTWSKEPVGDEALGKIAEALERIATAVKGIIK